MFCRVQYKYRKHRRAFHFFRKRFPWSSAQDLSLPDQFNLFLYSFLHAEIFSRKLWKFSADLQILFRIIIQSFNDLCKFQRIFRICQCMKPFLLHKISIGRYPGSDHDQSRRSTLSHGYRMCIMPWREQGDSLLFINLRKLIVRNKCSVKMDIFKLPERFCQHFVKIPISIYFKTQFFEKFFSR